MGIEQKKKKRERKDSWTRTTVVTAEFAVEEGMGDKWQCKKHNINKSINFFKKNHSVYYNTGIKIILRSTIASLALASVAQWIEHPPVANQNRGSSAQFLVRAHAWVVGQVSHWGACKRQPGDVSLTH